jgi:hypothetical protein
MRWLLVPLGVLLLVWLASGDARAQAWRWEDEPLPHDIQGVVFTSPQPGVVGAWVTLAPDACDQDRILQARFLYGGVSYIVEAPLPACPSLPVFLGRALPSPPPGKPAVATHAYVAELVARSGAEDAFTQRYPAHGFLPEQPLARPVGPLPALAWSAANVGAVSSLWARGWWRDPTR